MKAHLAAITSRQLRVIDQLGKPLSSQGFYLAGGTALALQMGHRKSIDLDWFVPEGLDSPLDFAGRLQAQGIKIDVVSIDDGALHAQISGVRVSFLRYRYPMLNPFIQWRAHGCQLASLNDIACMKLVAIAQRGAKKDFIDLYALLESKSTTLPRLFENVQRKYRLKDTGHMLHALTYFADADAEPTPKMLLRVTWPQIKTAIKRAVQTYARQTQLGE
jgi:hypothetical protein